MKITTRCRTMFLGALVSVAFASPVCAAELIITSDAFEGLTSIKRHKLVYACVNEQIASGELHALTIVAKTPAELGESAIN